jgi:glycosyltransferase involved in cell wall biosynthesis
MKASPQICIVTSTYNRAEIVRKAIESVRAQDFTDWEMCVVGDCTPDHTGDVVASFNDPRLKFYNLPEKSPPRAHGSIAKNHAIFKMSSAPRIGYLDDDDLYHPDFLSTMMGFLASNPAARVAYCRCQYLDKKTGRRIWGNPFQRFLHGYSREKLKKYNFIDTDCVIHDKSLVEEVGGWNPEFYFDDYELWLRMSEKCDFAYLNRVLVDKFVSEPPFLVRAFAKGMKILRHGRTTPLE